MSASLGVSDHSALEETTSFRVIFSSIHCSFVADYGVARAQFWALPVISASGTAWCRIDFRHDLFPNIHRRLVLYAQWFSTWNLQVASVLVAHTFYANIRSVTVSDILTMRYVAVCSFVVLRFRGLVGRPLQILAVPCVVLTEHLSCLVRVYACFMPLCLDGL